MDPLKKMYIKTFVEDERMQMFRKLKLYITHKEDKRVELMFENNKTLKKASNLLKCKKIGRILITATSS